MHLLHHHTHFYFPHYTETLKKDINGIYMVHSARGFVFALFGIFIPIYLLSLEFSLTLVLSFYIVRRISVMLVSFLVGSIGNRLGLKHTMLISLPLTLLYLIVLSFLEAFTSPWLLFSLAIMGGAQASFYWIPLHSLFSRYTKNGRRSSQVGKLLSFQHIATLAAPLLGGIITVFFGFEVLFFVAFLLLLLPIGILLYSPEIKPHVNFKFKDGLDFFKKYKAYYFQLSTDLAGQASEGILWPIFIYSILANELAIGLVGTLVGLGTIIFTIFIGKLTNRHNFLKMIKISAFLLALVWIAKYFAETSLVIYLLSILAGFFTIMFAVPHMSKTYELAKKEKHPDEFIIFREVPIAAGNVAILLFAIFVAEKIELSFLAVGFSYFLLLFI